MAASSSSSAAAADSRPPKYDVFISFRGEETRKGFTSHLYDALCQKQINAYIDEESLQKGDDISRALPKAIEESTISIIIFSEDYASSRWCLDELVHILKCREEKDQIVLTIFYGIDPSHIRHQKGTYAAAFVKHQERFKDKMDKVEEWRQALTRAADLSGWDLQGKSESVLVKQVVEDVMRKLESISSISIDDLKGLVGIRRQLCEIESLLCFDSPNVRILGIWGMGGIGKTTLAGVVFKCFSNRFEGTCFLESVREQSQRKGLVELEKEVFSKLLGEKDPDVSNPFVNVRLSRTKALLVLDDVDDFEQLERLAGDCGRFGPGSKIILTSRDLQVLNQLIDVRYEVQALDLKEASQLFYWKSFGENSCRTGYEEISANVVRYTGGNPLALKVLGSSLKSLGVKQWQSALEYLRSTPHVDIQKALRISYDGLGTKQQDIFLDIACILKDENRDVVEGILGHESIYAIDVLVNKSLITVNQYGLIGMHDLIQEMGWEIVRQSTKELGKRSRLWTAEDVSDVLNNNEGTKAIEGIYLPSIKEHEDVHLRPDVFKKMRKLRLLKFYASHSYIWNGKGKVAIDGDLESLPNSLRYLHWEHYPGKSLPSNNFKPQYLVELRMPNSKLEQLWDGVQELGSLKHINLQRSKFLTKIPDLSLAPKLEKINLSETALKELPSSIESLENLLRLELSSCRNLKSLPKLPKNIVELELGHSGIEQITSSSIECLYSLRSFSLRFCSRLKSLPSNINLKALENLNLEGTSIQELPSTIENSIGLRTLFLERCEHLEVIPESLCKLTGLLFLNLNDCSRFETLSLRMLSGLCSLMALHLNGCNIREIPACIGMLYELKSLDITNCKNLQSLPELPLFIETVHAHNCLSLEKVSTLRSTLTLGRWLDKYDSDRNSDSDSDSDWFDDRRLFSFLNCTKLGEDAINNIFREFLYKVFCTATTPPKVVVSKRVMRTVVVRYPTKEIPRWFNNQSEGSSITITLPPNWYNPKTFLGFVVSVVVAEVDDTFEPLTCELHLKTNCGESLEQVVFEFVHAYQGLHSDHIVMGYSYFDRSKANFEKYQEASFEFKTFMLKVKRCGVRTLYLKDAVEESDDGTTANFESWRIDSDTDYATTYDSDEPPPKRTRIL